MNNINSFQEADDVIAALLKHGHDYSSKRAEIEDLFTNQLYEGNWDSSTDFGDSTPDLRLIQEDEYDQHMDDGGEDGEDQRPAYIVYASGHYVMLA